MTKYFNYLLIERGVAQNTLESYGRDLRRFIFFVEESRKITDIKEVTPEVIVEYLTRIREEGLAANSMNRSLAALRGFYKYLLREKIIIENPLANIELAKVWMKLPDTISKEEMRAILDQPGTQTTAAIRNTAMLELLYATGIRVSELVNLTMNSINWQVGFLIVMGKGSKERIVPIGKIAYDCTRRYVDEARTAIHAEKKYGCVVFKSLWRKIYQTGLLENSCRLRQESRIAKEGLSAHVSSFFCIASVGRRRRLAYRTGNARTC